MISKKHKTIFIHIEKTAGTSIEHKLGLFNELKRGVQDHNRVTYYEHISSCAYHPKSIKFAFYCFSRFKFKKAFKYLKYLVNPELTKKEYISYYKFTFVRNTWSRIFSFYYNVMNDNYLKDIYGINDECSLYDFVKSHLDYKNFNQIDYITDSKGDIPLDFVGRFENLEADFRIICGKLKIKDSTLPKLLMIDGKKSYRDGYDQKARDLVNEIYKKEIDFFNFEF